MKYFVGTVLEDLMAAADDLPVAMLDGTVPNWKPRVGDLHYDHHRIGGAMIQLDEMQPHPRFSGMIATTQLDADACCAAAYLQCGQLLTKEEIRKLRAIAWDCDHLGVSSDLADLREFAAKAVATFKVPAIRDRIPLQLGLDPSGSKDWSNRDRLRVSALAFEDSTKWLMAAAMEQRPWPGELGEADDYQAKLLSDAEMLLEEGRVWIQDGIPVGSGIDLGYVDPRSFLLAWEKSVTQAPFTLTVGKHKAGYGVVYTLASRSADLTMGIFDRLTAEEKKRDPSAEGWGGRSTVGGSGWNTPSNLTVNEILKVLKEDLCN